MFVSGIAAVVLSCLVNLSDDVFHLAADIIAAAAAAAVATIAGSVASMYCRSQPCMQRSLPGRSFRLVSCSSLRNHPTCFDDNDVRAR